MNKSTAFVAPRTAPDSWCKFYNYISVLLMFYKNNYPAVHLFGGGGKLHVANFERINFCGSFFFDVSIFFYLKQFLVFMVYKVYLLLIIIIIFYKNSKDYP